MRCNSRPTAPNGSTQVIEGLEKDDVVELIFEEGIHRWVTVEELERDYKYQLSRGGEAGVLEIPSQLPTGETSRGATTWALKALRVPSSIRSKILPENLPRPGIKAHARTGPVSLRQGAR